MAQIDKDLGRRIKQHRQALGLSELDLANRISVKLQQLKHYEAGKNRIAASRLWRIADALGVSVVRLFQRDPVEDRDSNEVCAMLDLFDGLPNAPKSRALYQMRALSDGKQSDSVPPYRNFQQ